MSVTILHGSSDGLIDQIMPALDAYQADHPNARIDLYRQDSVSVRLRVVDPEFEPCSRTARHDQVWQYLDRLPEDVLAEISMLVLVAPDEHSLANSVFEEPMPTGL